MKNRQKTDILRYLERKSEIIPRGKPPNLTLTKKDLQSTTISLLWAMKVFEKSTQSPFKRSQATYSSRNMGAHRTLHFAHFLLISKRYASGYRCGRNLSNTIRNSEPLLNLISKQVSRPQSCANLMSIQISSLTVS